MVPEHLGYESDLATGIAKLRMKAASEIEDPGIRKRILNSLNAAEDVAANVQVRGTLKVGKKNNNNNVTADNIVLGKRNRSKEQADAEPDRT